MARRAWIALVGLAAMATASGLSPAGRAQEYAGVYSQADVVVGAGLYSGRCAVCHGLDGGAVGGVDLKRGQFRTAVTDEDVKRVIRTGVPPPACPSSLWTRRA